MLLAKALLEIIIKKNLIDLSDVKISLKGKK